MSLLRLAAWAHGSGQDTAPHPLRFARALLGRCQATAAPAAGHRHVAALLLAPGLLRGGSGAKVLGPKVLGPKVLWLGGQGPGSGGLGQGLGAKGSGGRSAAR